MEQLDWIVQHKPDSVTPRQTNCRMDRDLPRTNNRRWYVFSADYGGQILATIPVELVPTWVGRRRLRRTLRVMNGWGGDELDHMDVHIVEDFGRSFWLPNFEDDPEGYHLVMELQHAWILRSRTRMPLGLSMADLAQEPFDEPTKLEGWTFLGWVSGGMGGGRLLDRNLWVHYELLYRGLDQINEIRRLLGLPRMNELKLNMVDQDRDHMDLITAVLG